jgi:TatD DNase family protein
MDAQFIDTHAHAQFSAYDNDRKEVIDRALSAGVFMINVGTQKDTSRLAVEMAREYPEGVYAAVGLHPIHTEESHHDAQELGGGEAAQKFVSRAEKFDANYYETLASDPKVVAIGECGLDYYHLGEETRLKQKDAFEAQINLAYKLKKPLMIHCRDAFPDLIDILAANRGSLPSANVAHSFVRTVDEARKLLNFGFYFTFAGNITYKPRADKPTAYDVIKFIPSDRLLSETDAPYLAPVPHRGKRNEPAYIIEVVKKMAEIKNVSLEEMRGQIWANAKKTFLI